MNPAKPANPALGVGRAVAGWRLLRRLGRGTHGAVFLAARDDAAAAASVPVALKLVLLPAGDAAARAAFLQQAEAVKRLVHPGIVTLHEAGIAGDIGWLAMEAVPGGDLARHTQPARLLPVAKVLRIGERVARALAYAHEHGCVHRDLKPANVLVHWPSDSVKLADLGLARTAGAEATKTGVVPGTPAYMAPEQLAGAVPDARTDLYALGATLYQLLSGHLPHEAHTMGELLRRAAHEPVPPLGQWRPDLPPALGALLARLLARERAAREDNATAVTEALAAIAGSLRS